jgi:hypothetical protein
MLILNLFSGLPPDSGAMNRFPLLAILVGVTQSNVSIPL